MLKDAVRLLVYLLATVLVGALLAPPLFWAAQWSIAHGWLTFLGRFDFETFFHRSLLIAAVILVWPFARSLSVRSLADLELEKNSRWRRDWLAGFVASAIPLLCCAAILLATPIYQIRNAIDWSAVGKAIAAAAVVPLIEETFFRGLVLGVLLKSGRRYFSMFVTSALYSIVHFLKAPDHTSSIVTWSSGFNSIGHAFVQFYDPMLVIAGFTTLFLIGWILAYARLQTRSLWLPIGLHAGWILTAGAFNKVARHDMIILPWLGKNLLVGVIPLAVAGVTWLIVTACLRQRNARN
ncbi:MAG TPA: CPBP family intramembrane glutamic endopeptidase [Chthoniobacterales bacterium]|nr:CPBP family intramembrane glutamic endopeptidase [Chthoniobacterales bacterium]